MLLKSLVTTGAAMIAATTAILALAQPASAGTNTKTITDGVGTLRYDNNAGGGKPWLWLYERGDDKVHANIELYNGEKIPFDTEPGEGRVLEFDDPIWIVQLCHGDTCGNWTS